MPDQFTRADSIRFYGSGANSDGNTQANADLSLGNYRSSLEVQSLSWTIVNPISNVTILSASDNNGTGAGTLAVTGDDTLTWTAPGGAAGVAVTILSGETKTLESFLDPSKFIRVQRTNTTPLAGNATVTLAEVFNNVIGFDNVLSAEASTGDSEYRLTVIKNLNATAIGAVKVWIGTLGTQRVSASTQLGAAGAGTVTISAGTFDDWPDTGFCHIKNGANTREVVYYSARTSTVLTVPATGRAMLGTTAAAGAATDTLDAVPGIRIARVAPSSQPSGNFATIANENTAPAGVVTWSLGTTAADGLDVGTLASQNIQGIWIHRQVPPSAVAAPSVRHRLRASFDA
ncbi:MAG TPA: hypothetical protein VGN72_19770 [Tepidisphaeraceae bacterium]|jgi:hypothetical protein|nr:hypothetical protein [Tepidisphaeraceae bacterium]